MKAEAPPIIGVVGPTGSGKTDLALALAVRMPVEILVADSRQVYRGMDIGTATPDAEARSAVRHHLLDLVGPDQSFSVALWVEQARLLIPEIAARGRLSMLVGGTGLYIEALLAGHDYAGVSPSAQRRTQLTDRLAVEGLTALAEELVALDPSGASRIDLRNPRRVLRAIERVEGGESRAQPEPWPGPIALVGLRRPREVLYRRIDARAQWMFTEGGLLDEVRVLLAAGYGPELDPMTGHGYREAAAELAGEISRAEAIERTARRTRQYAKRQLSWFRREPRIMWLEAGERAGDDPALVADAERMLRAALR